MVLPVIRSLLASTSRPEWNYVRHHGDSRLQKNHSVPISNMSAMADIFKFFNPILPNHTLDRTKTWQEAQEQHGDSELLKSFLCPRYQQWQQKGPFYQGLQFAKTNLQVFFFICFFTSQWTILSYVGMSLPGLNQYLAGINVSNLQWKYFNNIWKL